MLHEPDEFVKGWRDLAGQIGGSIRAKIIIGFFVLILISMLIVTIVASNLIGDGISRQGMLQVESITSVVQEIYKDNYDQGEQLVRYLAANPEVTQYLQENRRLELFRVVERFERGTPVSSVTIAGLEGRQFAQMGHIPPAAFDVLNDLADEILLDELDIYKGRAAVTPDGIVIFGAFPVRDMEEEAVAVIGYHMDNRYIDDLREITKAHITIFHEDDIIATSIRDELDVLRLEELPISPADLEKARQMEEGIHFTTMDLVVDPEGTRESFLVGLSPIDPELENTIMAVSISRLPVVTGLRTARYTLVGLFGVTLAIGVGLAYLVSSVISKPIVDLSRTAKAMGTGDLRVDFKSFARDEVGILQRGFQAMANNLRELLGHIQSSSERVAHSAEQLSSSAQEANAVTEDVATTMEKIAAGTEEQAQSIEQTSAIVEEVSASVDEVSSGAQVVSDASATAKEKAELGNNAVRAMMEKMEVIKETTRNSVNVIQDLDEMTGEITSIIDTIKEIIDQTNLLALNAAIEAARAGEYGRGFAVVAEQIKSLSDESKTAADRIVSILTGIQDETGSAVKAIQDEEVQVDEGVKLAEEAGQALEEISEAIDRTVSVAQQIAAATQEQMAATEEIVKAIEKVSVVSDRTAEGARTTAASTEEQLATVEDVFRAAEHLSQMAEELKEALARFQFKEE